MADKPGTIKTVGDLRKWIEGLSDETPVTITVEDYEGSLEEMIGDVTIDFNQDVSDVCVDIEWRII